MSTFTQFNSPCCNNNAPDTKSIIDLVSAYNNLLSTLNNHIANDDAHNISDAINSSLNNYARLESVNTINNKIGNDSIVNIANSITEAINKLNADLNKKSDVSDITNINNEIDDIKDSVNTKLATSDAAKTYAAKETVEELTSTVDAIKIITDKLELDDSATSTITFNTIIETTEYIIGKLKALDYIDFTSWHETTAHFAGIVKAGDNGIYIIGALSVDFSNNRTAPTDTYKAGTLYLKYKNTTSLDAILNFTVSKVGTEYYGKITAIYSKKPNTWKHLKFYLLNGTTANKDMIYIGISADGMSTSAVGTSLIFYTSGINCLPFISEYKPNGTVHAIDTFDTTNIVIGDSETERITLATLPIVADGFTNLGVPIGSIIYWPQYNEKTHVAENIPDGFVATNGNEVYRADYDTLADVLGINKNEVKFKLPLQDYSIIKYK